MSQPQAPDFPPLPGQFRTPNFGEEALFDAYREALKTALAASSSAAEKVLTGGLGLATAYGALIGLVQPEKSPAPLIAVLPFLPLAGAAYFAVRAITSQISISVATSVSDVIKPLTDAIATKQRYLGIATILLAIAIIVAGLAVWLTYR